MERTGPKGVGSQNPHNPLTLPKKCAFCPCFFLTGTLSTRIRWTSRMQNPVENKAGLGILCSYIIKSVVLLARSYLSMQLGFVRMQSGTDRTKKRAQEAPSPRRKIVTLLFTLHPSFINERFPCSGSSTRLFFHPSRSYLFPIILGVFGALRGRCGHTACKCMKIFSH